MQNLFLLAGLDISRNGPSKIETRLSYLDDKTPLHFAEILKVRVQELFPSGWDGILRNGVRDLLPQGNRKRALQVFDQIVYVFYSDGYADKVSWQCKRLLQRYWNAGVRHCTRQADHRVHRTEADRDGE